MAVFHKNVRAILLVALVAATAVIWYAVFYFESHQNLLVTFFDVGQGDAIFIEVPNGNQVLIDGGPGNAVLAKLGRAMPFWDRSIDLLLLTHPHADHLDGLVEVLKRYDVDTVIETGVEHSIPEYAEWHELLKNKSVRIVITKAGERVRLSGSVYLDILAPSESFEGKSPKDIHEAMVVSKLMHAFTSALFMGDAEKSLECQLLFGGAHVKTDVLKVGHHGSKTSSAEDFLKIASPQFAIISAGKKNRYGHPHQEVLDRLAALGVSVLRTDQNGDIRFASDGMNFRRMGE